MTAHCPERPLVSVLTPSFNQARWLEDNLASVRCQTYPYIEHIVMDGGSTDGSADVLERAGDSVTWRSEPDRGQPHALNKALAASTGEIIGWLNSDDAFFDCDVVADVVDYFERHPDVDVAYGHAARVTEDGRIIYVIWVPPFNRTLLTWMCFFEQPAVFLRRRAIEERFVDESYQFAMDWELWLHLAFEGRRFGRMRRVLSIDRLQAERKMKTWLPVLEENRGRLGETYGVKLPWFYFPLERLEYVASRLGGIPYVLSMPKRLAFSGEQDDRWTLLKRQAFSRKSRWPKGWV